MKKILYCISGMTAFGVIMEEITERKGFLIQAPRIFIMQQAPTTLVRAPKGEVQFIIAIYENVTVNCDLISDLSPNTAFYKGIMDGLSTGTFGGKNPNEN